MEGLEGIGLGRLAKPGLVENYSPPAAITIEQSSAGQMAIDVYGQPAEPICSYRTCHHNFHYMARVLDANVTAH